MLIRSVLTSAPAGFLLLQVPGMASEKNLALSLRSRIDDHGTFRIVAREQQWPAQKMAIIVCDMWDAHHCLNAVRREEQMVPRMNEVLEKARDQGVLIIHAPS